MTEFYIGGAKSEKTKKVIGKILFDYINNPSYFEDMGIVEISQRYRVCNKSLSRYMKGIFVKNKEKKNGKILKLDHNTELFFNDLSKIIKKYDTHLTNKEVEFGKYFLNNLKC